MPCSYSVALGALNGGLNGKTIGHVYSMEPQSEGGTRSTATFRIIRDAFCALRRAMCCAVRHEQIPERERLTVALCYLASFLELTHKVNTGSLPLKSKVANSRPDGFTGVWDL